MNNLDESHSFYRKKEIERGIKPVGKVVYLKIITGFIQFFLEKVCEGHEVKIPARLGTIRIVGKKVKPKLNENGDIVNLAPDWKSTIEYWNSNPEAKENKEKIYHLNEHTNGVRYKYVWSKKNVNIINKTVYGIRFSRFNKRRIIPDIRAGKEYIVTNFKQWNK